MHENCLSLRDLLSITLPFSSSSFFLHNTYSLPLASSSSDAAEQTCVVDSGSHPKRTREGAAAAAFPVVELCNSVRKKKKQRLGSELLQISREPWSIVGRLQLWNTSTSTSSVADLQRDHRTIDCLALTDGEISICCSVASLHPQFLGQLVQITCWTFVPRTACSAVCRHAVVKCSSVVEAAAAEGSKKFFSCSGNTNVSQKYVGKGKIVHGPSCSGEDYKSSLSAGGCLEIHNLKLLAGSSALSLQLPTFPSLSLSPTAADIGKIVCESPQLKKRVHNSQVKIWGLLHCISPPFVLPSKDSPLSASSVAKSAKSLAWNGTEKSVFKQESAGQTIMGFIVELRMCPHIPSCEYNALLPAVGKECVHVYFSGSVASWRPVLSVVIGQCVTITGLQRKLILVGPEKNEHLLFVATKSSLVSQLSPSGCVPMDCVGKEPYFRARKRDPTTSGVTRATIHKELACDSKEGAQFGSYIGIVTDIPMPGQLVELNKRAWLLLTHYNVTQLHGLRVGAMVAVRHVHIMVLDSAGEKGLLLGACFRSHVCVVLSSDLNVMPVLQQPSRNHLSKHMEHLPFASTFWVLQVIVSLRCKFQGVYTQKQLIGSKKCAGIIQACLPILLTTPVTLHRDVFKEFFWHNRFCRLGEDLPSRLSTKVPPISNFCYHIESLWHDPHSIVWQAGKKHCDCFDRQSEWNPSLGLQSGENSAHYVRRIISSAELGIVLIGSLRVCQDSGKLQLVDATGALDVMIPDLRCFANLSSTYQITSFSLVVEGKWRTSTQSAEANRGRLPNSAVAYSTLLKGLVFKMEPSNLLSYYVHFQIQHASCFKNLVWPSRETCTSNPSWLRKFSQIEGHNNSWKGRQFEILMATRKHPVRLKPGVEAGEGNQWTLYAEAILLPFCLRIVGESSAPNECSYLPVADIQMDLRKSRMTNLNKRPDAKYQEGGLEGSNADLNNSATGNRVVTGCSIRCSVCFLLNEYPGGKMKVEQHAHTYSSSLDIKGCLKMKEKLGSEAFCSQTEEECLGHIRDCDFRKVILEFDQSGSEYSQILQMGHFYLLPILQSEPQTFTNLKNSLEVAKFTVRASCPLLSLAWSFSEDGHPSRTNAVATDSLEILSGQKLPKLYCLCQQAEQKSPGYNDNTVTDIYAHGRSPSGIISRCICNSGTTVQQSSDMRHLNACTAVLDEYMQVQDVVLTVGKTSQKYFRNLLTKLKAQAVGQLLSVREALDCASHPAKTVSDSLSNHEEASENKSDPGIGANSAGIFALQGALVSVCGQVESMEPLGSFASLTSDHQLKLRQPFSSSSSNNFMEHQPLVLNVQDLNGRQIIKVHCNFEKYVCPVGLGPGVIACFRHILLQRSPNVQLQSLPTTLIEVHSIRERLPVVSQGAQMNNLLTALAKHQRRPVDLLDCPKKLDLLSDLVNRTDISGRYLRLHCRVVGVQNLDLQWQGSLSFQSAGLDYDWLSMNCQEMLHCISVTLGCFTIDDGSSVADCWATGQVATELLRFPSLFEKTQAQLQILTSRIFPVLKRGSEMEASLDQVLCMLVHCHGRITVETEGSQAETGNMSWVVKGADGNTLQEEEGVILRVIMQRACQMSSLVVECSALSIEEKMAIHTGEKRVPTSTLALINGRPMQTQVCKRIQLFARSVESVNSWRELQNMSE